MSIGRNHPCPCGSGEKYKKCCRRSVEPDAPIEPPDDSVQLRTSSLAAAQRLFHGAGAVGFGEGDEDCLADDVRLTFAFFDCPLDTRSGRRTDR